MNELVVKNNLVPTENEFHTIQAIARMAASSGLYQSSAGAEPKIMMILLAARELGISPMIALNGGIWNIQGKIEISARLMNAMIRRAGHSITVKQCDANICILEGKRGDNGDSFSAQFSIQDAQKAGLANRATWKTYTEDMLYSRSMSRLARRLFPDVIGTAYVEGEIRDVKCEIVSHEREEVIEDPEVIELKVLEFINNFPEEKHIMMREYLTKYSNHWKKNMIQSINDYSDNELFLKDFNKWELKNKKSE